MPQRPRILILEGPDCMAGDLIQERRLEGDLVRIDGTRGALPFAPTEHFDGIYIDTSNPVLWERVAHLFQAEGILETLGEGVALIDLQLRITWANLMFEVWCDGPVRGLGFYEALGSPQISAGLLAVPYRSRRWPGRLYSFAHTAEPLSGIAGNADPRCQRQGQPARSACAAT